jgi:hypothetical protein
MTKIIEWKIEECKNCPYFYIRTGGNYCGKIGRVLPVNIPPNIIPEECPLPNDINKNKVKKCSQQNKLS